MTSQAKATLVILCFFLNTACNEVILLDRALDEYEAEKKSEHDNTNRKPAKKADGLYVNENEGSKTRSEYRIEDGRVEGVATQYYENGALWKKSPYHQGKLHGKAQIYYRSGELKREVHYENGKKHGPYTKYYKSGTVKAKIEYHQNLPVPGIVETDYQGKAVEQPTITVEEIDSLAINNRYYLVLSLACLRKASRFYLSPYREDWRGDNERLNENALTTIDGKAFFPLVIEPGETLRGEIQLFALYKSSHGLKAALHRSYRLDLKH